MPYADELHELLRREQEQNITSTDSNPAVDAYLKANAASSPDHIATQVSADLRLTCTDRSCLSPDLPAGGC